jgi:hypothetical protein
MGAGQTAVRGTIAENGQPRHIRQKSTCQAPMSTSTVPRSAPRAPRERRWRLELRDAAIAIALVALCARSDGTFPCWTVDVAA